MKKVFLTFADSRMKVSSDRIKKQANSMLVYDRILTADESTLDSEFRKELENRLVLGSRGYGYWAWKPQIILQTLADMNEGDMLQYTDVGCHLNVNGRARLLDYFNYTEKAKSGILAFQANQPISPLNYDGRQLLDLPDYKWIKGDLLDYFHVRDSKKILDSQTIGATVIFIRKTAESIAIINKWNEVAKNDFSLIDDSPSKSSNLPGFIEHRHDQAIFSILCKLNRIETISAYEYWYPSKGNLSKVYWDELAEFPIHARRDKKISFKYRLLKRVLNKLNLNLG